MKSLQEFILEKMKKCCAKLDKNKLKLMAAGKYKSDKKFIDFIKKHIKESLVNKSVINESEEVPENLLEDFKYWVQNTIDSWIRGYDDDFEDMKRAEEELDTADDYFSNNFEEFLEEYDYEDDVEWNDAFNDIIADYVESSKEYLEETYEHWGGRGNADEWD